MGTRNSEHIFFYAIFKLSVHLYEEVCWEENYLLVQFYSKLLVGLTARYHAFLQMPNSLRRYYSPLAY